MEAGQAARFESRTAGVGRRVGAQDEAVEADIAVAAGAVHRKAGHLRVAGLGGSRSEAGG